jgi:subtilisin family serine protease
MAWHRRLFAASLAAAAAACAVPDGAAPAAGGKVGAPVRDALATSPRVRVIVSLREPETTVKALSARSEEIATTRHNVLSELLASDFRLTHQWEHVAAVAGDVSAEGLERLESNPHVRRVDLDPVEKVLLSESVGLIHGSEAVARGFAGDNIVVAVLDTGSDIRHPDIGESVVAETCFCTGCCPNGSSTQSGEGASRDGHGHGTHVAGIIAAPGIAQPVGVAPGSFIASVKVLSDSGSGLGSDIISGLNWVLGKGEIRVVNMSLGGGRYSTVCDSTDAGSQAYASAISALRGAGVLVVAAAGNDGFTDAVTRPACVNAALAVGAVYDDNVGGMTYSSCSDPSTSADRVTCFSNSSTLVELLAPGSLITSAGVGGGTATMAGTSQAAPHVAGAAAVLLSANSGLSPDRMTDILVRTGRPVTDRRNGLTLPRIDLEAAVAAAR